ncbi:ACT domain-containing protein [Halovenus sp. WSH3]|uniref:ACT domain-containing protein n=1 Tax=Halovenus carboxidivorans TaxID=2692199 RepID=A0A6B0T699_9EURY|nr:ACT domain-containing protein [Halovenus carboxidivorans]MXR50802.1 ACT domain-containing protein [Halovenus carboxidivorans]
MDPIQVLQDGAVRVSEATYAVCRTDHSHPAAFATIRDETETTLIIEESEVGSLDAETVETGWKRLTFEMELPFELVGFLATVATELAEADVSVFVVSSYSTDHVLVKQENLDDALSRLEELGCRILMQ